MNAYTGMAGCISDCLNRLVQDVLDCAPALILMIFFCKVKIFPLLKGLPQKIIPYFYNRMKICIVNRFESVNVTDMEYRPDVLTCCT